MEGFFQRERPDVAIIAAARVGGIQANNTYPAEFLQENLAIALNCVHAAFRAGVRRLLFLGSSCIYPKLAAQPITEEALLTGALEPTNEAYAIAKIAGLKLCSTYRSQHGKNFISAMPTNLYGINDNFIKELGSTIKPNSSALFLLIRKVTGDKVLERLKAEGYTGHVLQTSLTNEQEAALKKAISEAGTGT